MDRMGSDTGGGARDANPRPDWRRRDPSATVVYVVHPTEFRSVVQKLTGAPPAGTTHQQHSSAPPPPAAPASANAAAEAAQRRGGDEHRSSRRTLGQMHHECAAWADSADDF